MDQDDQELQLQYLLHDENCSDDVIDFVTRDEEKEFMRKCDKVNRELWELMRPFNPKKLVKLPTNKMIFEIDSRVDGDDFIFAVPKFAISPAFDFSKDHVDQLFQTFSADPELKFSKYVFHIQHEIDYHVNLHSYPFVAFVIATLMLREPAIRSIRNLKLVKPETQQRAFNVYTKLAPLMFSS